MVVIGASGQTPPFSKRPCPVSLTPKADEVTDTIVMNKTFKNTKQIKKIGSLQENGLAGKRKTNPAGGAARGKMSPKDV